MVKFHGIEIEKGQLIPLAVVLKATKKEKSEDKVVPFILLTFAKRMESFLRAQGYDANCKATPRGVAWLTDSEALQHNAKRRRMGRRKIRRALTGVQNVNVAELTEDEQKQHDQLSRTLVMEVASLRTRRPPEDFAMPAKSGR